MASSRPKRPPKWPWMGKEVLTKTIIRQWVKAAINHLQLCKVEIMGYNPTKKPPVKIRIGLLPESMFDCGIMLSWRAAHKGSELWCHFYTGDESSTQFIWALLKSMNCYPRMDRKNFRGLCLTLAVHLESHKQYEEVMRSLAISYENQMTNFNITEGLRSYEIQLERQAANQEKLRKQQFVKFEAETIEFVQRFISRFSLEDDKVAAKFLYKMRPSTLRNMEPMLSENRHLIPHIDDDRFERGFNIAVVSRVIKS